MNYPPVRIELVPPDDARLDGQPMTGAVSGHYIVILCSDQLPGRIRGPLADIVAARIRSQILVSA